MDNRPPMCRIAEDEANLPITLEPLMSVKLTAKILGVSEKTLRDWVWRKKVDYVKSGDRVVFEPEAIRQFIARNRVKAKVM